MSLNARDLVMRVVNAVAALAQQALDDPEPKPGLILIALRLLAGAPRELVPSSLDANLEAACAISVGNPFVYPTLMDLRIARAASDPVAAKLLKTEHVQQALREAEAQSGMGRSAQLRIAHGLAARYGLTDKQHEIETMIQAMGSEDMELKVVESEVSIPRSDLEAYMSFFVDAGTWQDALTRFAAGGVPLKDERTARQQTEEMCEGLCLSSHLRQHAPRANGLPIPHLLHVRGEHGLQPGQKRGPRR